MQQETLRGLRLQSGKTVAEVANVLGVTVRAVSRYEAGERQISLKQVLQLSDLYDSTPEEIIRAQLNSVAVAET